MRILHWTIRRPPSAIRGRALIPLDDAEGALLGFRHPRDAPEVRLR